MRHSPVTRVVLPRPTAGMLKQFPDAGFQWLLHGVDMLLVLLRLLRPDLAPLLDVPQASRLPRRARPDDLRNIENDALFSIPFLPGVPGARRDVPALVLVEHKAVRDPAAPLQALDYLLPSWNRQLPQSHPGDPQEPRFSPAAVLLAYTGKEPWPATPDLPELIVGPPALAPSGSLWQWSHLDLGRLPTHELRRIGTPTAWGLRLTQAEWSDPPVYESALLEVLAGVEAADASRRVEAWRVAWYCVQHLYHRRSDWEYNRLFPVVQQWGRDSKFQFRQGVTTMVRSMAMVERELAEARGVARGEAVMREALLDLLLGKFGDAAYTMQPSLAQAHLDDLAVWIRQAARAQALEEVGIPLPANGTAPSA